MANKTGCLEVINGIFKVYLDAQRGYNLLKNDPEKCEISTKLGRRSITWSIVTLIIIGLCCFGVYALVGNFLTFWSDPDFEDLPFLSLLGAIMCAVIVVYQFFTGFLSAITSLIYQSKLNKQPIRWTALIIMIICMVLSIVAIVIVLTSK